MMEAMINTDEDLSSQRLGHLAIELLVRADFVRCGCRLAVFDGAAAGLSDREIWPVATGMDSHHDAGGARDVVGHGGSDGGGHGHRVFDHDRNAVSYITTIRAETPAEVHVRPGDSSHARRVSVDGPLLLAGLENRRAP